MPEKPQKAAHQAGIPAVPFLYETRASPAHHQKGKPPFHRFVQQGGAELAFGKDRDFGAPVVQEGLRLGRGVGGRGLDHEAGARGQWIGAGQQDRKPVLFHQPPRQFQQCPCRFGRRGMQPDQPAGRARRAVGQGRQIAPTGQVVKREAEGIGHLHE